MTGPTTKALIRPTELAELAGVSLTAISKWKARFDDFPKPVDENATRPLYDYQEAVAWLRANGRLKREVTPLDILWSAMDTLRGPVSTEVAAGVLVSLLVIRKLAFENADVAAVWSSNVRRRGEAGPVGDVLGQLVSSVRAAAPGGRDLLPDTLRGLPIEPSQVRSLVESVDQLPATELAAAASAVITRFTSSLGRAAATSGTPGSVIAAVLASLATRVNLVDEVDLRTRPNEHAPLGLKGAVDEIIDRLPPVTAPKVVFDSACGIGESLLAVGRALPDVRLVGRDVVAETITLARQRAFLQGLDVDLASLDSIESDGWEGGLADAVVVEPPLNARPAYRLLDSDRRWRFGTPNGAAYDTAWIQDAIAHLAPGGRAYVIQAPGSEFRSGAMAAIRRSLVSAGVIEAVIALPPGLLPGATIPVSVWVLRSTGNPTDEIALIDASAPVDGIGNLVMPTSLILQHDAPLTPSRWIAQREADEVDHSGNVSAALAEFHTAVDGLADARLLTEAPAIDFVGTRVMPLGSLSSIETRPGRVRPERGEEHPDDVVRPRHLAAGADWPKRATQWLRSDDQDDLTRPGDVLVSTMHSIQAKVDVEGGRRVSHQVTIVTADPAVIRPAYLAYALRGTWNERFLTGATIRHARLRDLEIPLPTLAEQDRILEVLTALEAAAAVAAAVASAGGKAEEALLAAVRYGANLAAGERKP